MELVVIVCSWSRSLGEELHAIGIIINGVREHGVLIFNDRALLMRKIPDKLFDHRGRN